jgi:hypothetical protein
MALDILPLLIIREQLSLLCVDSDIRHVIRSSFRRGERPSTVESRTVIRSRLTGIIRVLYLDQNALRLLGHVENLLCLSRVIHAHVERLDRANCNGMDESILSEFNH